jgi:hypothetical protein
LAAALLMAAPLGAQCVPCAIGSAIVGGWLDQVRDDPKQWSRDAGGFGTRVASRFGQGLVTTSVTFSGGLITGTDQRYHPCGCTNTLARVAHGLLGPLTATTRSGATVVSPVQTIGAFAGGYTAMTWRPGRYDPVKGYQFALSAMAVNAGIDIIREFVR